MENELLACVDRDGVVGDGVDNGNSVNLSSEVARQPCLPTARRQG